MQIGKHKLANNIILAPMAGVTDRPFRNLCKNLGAGMVISEMVGSSLLYGSKKTLLRANHDGESTPKSTQIVGADPAMLSKVAKINQDLGADIIDINMGCPAKKICKVLSGSALMRDEKLVQQILTTVVKAVDIPVTLKIRTGWCQDSKNGVAIARIAQDCGIQALAVHGRTRTCFFKGEAEYNTIAAIKAAVTIPVIANGDIDSPEKAIAVMQQTNCDAIMIGRAAQGNPWIFKQINYYLEHKEHLPLPSNIDIRNTLTNHLENLYDFYGEYKGTKIARKHVSWYSKGQRGGGEFRHSFNRIETAVAQLNAIQQFFV